MKKREPFYKLSDEPIGNQLTKTQLNKHLLQVKEALKKALAPVRESSTGKKLISK